MRAILLLSTVFALTHSGCGSRTDYVSVKGVVTIGGKPLDHGTVSLIPDGNRGTKGSMGIGQIQANGQFEISTNPDGQKGVMPGYYLVRITEPVGSAEFGMPAPPVVPIRYSDPATSQLWIEIKPDHTGDVKFELTRD